MSFPRASQALSRFTVLDLTRVRSGPTCVRQLADQGANVIKIDALMEDAAGKQPGGPRHGSDFQNLHRNKRAMTLNLKDPRGWRCSSASPQRPTWWSRIPARRQGKAWHRL
jgi:crotonobetainyl-CoA:carnitine CoA-transferase CaiB-like acyl-CoA transferase